MSIELENFGGEFGLGLSNRDFLIQQYKSSVNEFGRFLLEQEQKGLVGSQKSEKGKNRQFHLEVHMRRYGKDSLFNTFKEPYKKGYYSLNQVLGILERKGVHTNDQLLAFNFENSYHIGPVKSEIIQLMKNIVAHELALK